MPVEIKGRLVIEFLTLRVIILSLWWQVTSDEYSDISSLLRHLEEEHAKKFCEFGGLVESLQVTAVSVGAVLIRVDREYRYHLILFVYFCHSLPVP